MKMNCGRGPYNKDSRTSQWRHKRIESAQSQDRCSCVYHDDDSDDCNCEFHKTNSPSCPCEFHCIEETNVSLSHDDDSWLYEFSTESNVSYSETNGEEPSNNSFCLDEEPHTYEDSLSGSVGASKPGPSTPTEMLLDGDENDSTMNWSDVIAYRLDHFRNEDSYSESEGNSESSDNEPSSVEDTPNDESDEDSNDENGGGDPDGGGPGGDDPEGDGDDLSNANDSNVNGVLDEDNFSLGHPSLNRVLQAAHGRTAKEVLAMILTLAAEQNLNYVTVVELCRIANVTNAFKALPSTKKQLWAVLQKKSAGIVKHAYCEKCLSVLGVLKDLPRVVVCNNELCDYRSQRRNVKYFITLSLTKQLKSLLSIPEIRQHLQYKYTRRKFNQDAREDVIDGDGYKALENMENGLQEFDLTCQLNTDGFSTSRSSNSQGWAILGRINELPPALRQKLTFLAGLIIADGEADLSMLFERFVGELSHISRNGIEWEHNEQLFISRMKPTCFCLDARARALLMNLKIYSGHYSCPFCLHPGVKLAGCMRFPLPGTEIVMQVRGVERVLVIPDAPLRTDAGVRHDMQQANANRNVHGFHGPSVLINLDDFNFATGFSPDDLHPIFLGVTKFLTNEILSAAANVEDLQAQIDGRLLKILTPSLISRKPRSISKRRKYKGTEWRNWLLYFGIPCMDGLISNANMRLFSLLSKGIFILSSDSVTDNDIEVAHECLQRFVTGFQAMHGPEKMRFNIHIMVHLAQAVRNWGPLHLHSTFPFESWNRRLRNNISSPHGAADQIVDRYLLESLVRKLPYDQELDEEVREELQNIASPYVMDNPLKIGDVYFFGKRARPRPPTADEIALLHNENLHCDLLTEYYQCRKSRMILHSTEYYVLADRTSKSNNSVIFTNDNQFYDIVKIVVFEHDGEEKCGLFCRGLEVGNALNGASHIKEVHNENNDAVQWISFDNVRLFAIKMPVRNRLFVAPMANIGEID